MPRSLLPLLQVAAVAALALAVSAAPPTTDDGTAVPSCASKLVPCGAFLNSTATPPATCCAPLKDAAFNETKCMCAMLLNKAALQAFGVAPDQGMALAKRCGVTVDASVCKNYSDAADAAGGSSTSTGAPDSTSTVTKPTANGSTKLRLSSTGFISIVWWTIIMA